MGNARLVSPAFKPGLRVFLRERQDPILVPIDRPVHTLRFVEHQQANRPQSFTFELADDEAKSAGSHDHVYKAGRRISRSLASPPNYRPQKLPESLGLIGDEGALQQEGALAMKIFSVETQAYAFGPIICSGRTIASNCSSVTKPSLTASSRRVVPFLCAVLATMVALS